MGISPAGCFHASVTQRVPTAAALMAVRAALSTVTRQTLAFTLSVMVAPASRSAATCWIPWRR